MRDLQRDEEGRRAAEKFNEVRRKATIGAFWIIPLAAIFLAWREYGFPSFKEWIGYVVVVILPCWSISAVLWARLRKSRGTDRSSASSGS